MAKITLEIRGDKLGLVGTANDGAEMFVPVNFHFWEPVGITPQGLPHDLDVFAEELRKNLQEITDLINTANAAPV